MTPGKKKGAVKAASPAKAKSAPKAAGPKVGKGASEKTAAKAVIGEAFVINGHRVEPGTRAQRELFVGRLPTRIAMNLPVEVVCGVEPGPRIWLSAAIHGDELNGVEIIHRILTQVSPDSLAGTVVAVPVVNVFGFVHQNRYLPDRRDLNRHFPGSARGSLASRLAQLLMKQIVGPCTHGIDLHTGSLDRTNLAQLRGDLTDPVTRRCAVAFGAPIMIHGEAPPKSLRYAAAKAGKHVLTYEAGEPQRFNPDAIEMGVEGVLRVMRELKMLEGIPRSATAFEAKRRTWVRAPQGGILMLEAALGETVKKRQVLGVIKDAFGGDAHVVRSPAEGLVIGHTNNPLVNRGDAIVHIARDLIAVSA